MDLEFLPQQLIDPVDGAAPREAAVEVCRPWAACLASFGRRKCKVCGSLCGLNLLCVRGLRIWSSYQIFHSLNFLLNLMCFSSQVHSGVSLCEFFLVTVNEWSL